MDQPTQNISPSDAAHKEIQKYQVLMLIEERERTWNIQKRI